MSPSHVLRSPLFTHSLSNQLRHPPALSQVCLGKFVAVRVACSCCGLALWPAGPPLHSGVAPDCFVDGCPGVCVGVVYGGACLRGCAHWRPGLAVNGCLLCRSFDLSMPFALSLAVLGAREGLDSHSRCSCLLFFASACSLGGCSRWRALGSGFLVASHQGLHSRSGLWPCSASSASAPSGWRWWSLSLAPSSFVGVCGVCLCAWRAVMVIGALWGIMNCLRVRLQCASNWTFKLSDGSQLNCLIHEDRLNMAKLLWPSQVRGSQEEGGGTRQERVAPLGREPQRPEQQPGEPCTLSCLVNKAPALVLGGVAPDIAHARYPSSLAQRGTFGGWTPEGTTRQKCGAMIWLVSCMFDSRRLRGARCSNRASGTLDVPRDAATASTLASVKHYGSPCPGLSGWCRCWQFGLVIGESLALPLVSPAPGQGHAALKFCLQIRRGDVLQLRLLLGFARYSCSTEREEDSTILQFSRTFPVGRITANFQIAIFVTWLLARKCKGI